MAILGAGPRLSHHFDRHGVDRSRFLPGAGKLRDGRGNGNGRCRLDWTLQYPRALHGRLPAAGPDLPARDIQPATADTARASRGTSCLDRGIVCFRWSGDDAPSRPSRCERAVARRMAGMDRPDVEPVAERGEARNSLQGARGLDRGARMAASALLKASGHATRMHMCIRIASMTTATLLAVVRLASAQAPCDLPTATIDRLKIEMAETPTLPSGQ